MARRLVLAGYFGRGNLGDDAILLGFTRAIKDLPYHYTVIGTPEILMRDYGLRGVSHTDVRAVNEAISEADALVFPGGSIFQDVSSTRSVAYYAGLVKAAKKANKKVVMVGQGVGPLNGFIGKKMAASAFAAADVIAVRDRESVNTLTSLGVKGSFRVTADMAFMLPKPPADEGMKQFGLGDMRSVGLSARPAGGDTKNVIKVFSQLMKLLFENRWVPSMIEMDRELDRPLLDKLGKEFGGKVPEIRGLTSPVQLQQRLMRMDAVIGMRLHAGILATSVGVPAYMVSYDPKVNAFANSMGFPAPLNIQGATAERIFDGFQSFVKDRERLVATVERKRDELSKQAQQNIEVLVAALGT
jgi:polysaccharide pyruvyl transferase CsaB